MKITVRARRPIILSSLIPLDLIINDPHPQLPGILSQSRGQLWSQSYYRNVITIPPGERRASVYFLPIAYGHLALIFRDHCNDEMRIETTIEK